MSAPRLLDLFCGAMGAGVGYARAGFDVTGVDIEPHRDAPFELIVGDAMTVLGDTTFLATFDAIHASPPCPAYSSITPEANRAGHPDLIVRHDLQPQVWGVYGDHGDLTPVTRPNGTSRGNKARDVAHAQEVLGIDWMTSWDDLTDAVPPSYCEFIGRQLLAHLETEAAA